MGRKIVPMARPVTLFTGQWADLPLEDLAEKEAVLEADPDAFFTIPHFDGYPAVLIRLHAVRKKALREAIEDGWLACAPRKLAEEHLG